MIQEKLHKVDDMARNMDRIAHDVETLKSKLCHPSMILMSLLNLSKSPLMKVKREPLG